MIHYHGTPITPNSAAAEVLQARHAFVSFAHPNQIDIITDVCQSFAMDNGAFTAWKSGKQIDNWDAYYHWVDEYKNHPAFDFAIIPDVIDGDEFDNDLLIKGCPISKRYMTPVWHMDESLDRFASLCNNWDRVCIGSSGEYSSIGDKYWWQRMGSALNHIINADGYPPCKLHGLRMLDPEIFKRLPLASADSTNIGRNIGIDKHWQGNYMPPDKTWRARIMAARIESINGSSNWGEWVQKDFLKDLINE